MRSSCRGCSTFAQHARGPPTALTLHYAENDQTGSERRYARSLVADLADAFGQPEDGVTLVGEEAALTSRTRPVKGRVLRNV